MKSVKYLIALILLTTVNYIQAKPADLKSSVNAAVKSYLDIKNALAADNGKAANDAAVGEHIITVSGVPKEGNEAPAEFKVKIDEKK